MMFCFVIGVAWISILFLEICIINPYIKFIKYPIMRKRGYIIEKGYLPYKPTDTIRIKKGYHNPLDAFGTFDDDPTVEMTPYGAMKALEKIISKKDEFEKCIEKSKRNSRSKIDVKVQSLNIIQKLRPKTFEKKY